MEIGLCKNGSSKNKSSGKEPDECFAKIKYYFLIAKRKQIILLIFEVIRFNLWFKRSRLRKKSKL